MADAPTLTLRVLGPIELLHGTERLALPRSKKSRALLAYLAVTGRAHRRERLCDLLWEGTDDARGALRWTLSRMRKGMGEAADLVIADRDEVALRGEGLSLDARLLSKIVTSGVESASLEELEAAAKLPRGEFLEGLDLTELLDFYAWCIGERERHRTHHARVLAELVQRLTDEPERALPHARKRAQTDAFELSAQTQLLELLLRENLSDEARLRFESSQRLYREVAHPDLGALEDSWRRLSTTVTPVAKRSREPEPKPREAKAPALSESDRAPAMWPFVGRARELAAMEALLERTEAGSAPRIALVTGEPGAGKSRLAERLESRAQNGGYAVLRGKAYEAEGSRPYGPFVDAFGLEIGHLVRGESGAESLGNRDALFVALAERLSARARSYAGIVLVLDDIQWLDSDSAELLHFVCRTFREAPLFIVLLARGGELSDNEPVLRALRGLRKTRRIEEIELAPLSLGDVEALLGERESAEVERIYAASAGNPLYAIELARAGARDEGTPASLLELVRERIEQLPPSAVDVLRWGAILGHAIDLDRLEALSSASLDDLMDALERLEHHALLRIDATRQKERYVFSHDVVREAVYGELSQPRRRLMHRTVARLLEPRTADAEVATEVAHHAALAGEALLGVRACIIAAQQSLRVFANGDAESLAKRGLHLAEELAEGERISATLDLLHIAFSARTPDREAAAQRVRALAERALDLGLLRAARLGFQMLSFLRWESSSMAAAHDNIMQAERVSRGGTGAERSAALANAAKCLVLLERNLSQAEAFVMEADALTSRSGSSSSAVCFATGMIAAHRGELERAIESFREARGLAREHGERLMEFCAVEHWVMLAIDRGASDEALSLSAELADLGGRVRPGAEAPAGRALNALSRLSSGEAAAEEPLREAIEELRVRDAKYELAFLLTRWAKHALDTGALDEATALAGEGLEVARAIGRPSETALAHVVLLRCAKATGDTAHLNHHEEALRDHEGALSAVARAEVDRALGP